MGALATDDILASNFAQLDFVLAPVSFLQNIFDITSHRDAAISSHHFLITCQINVAIPKESIKPRQVRFDFAALKNQKLAEEFAQTFASNTSDSDIDSGLLSINELNQQLESSFRQTAKITLPKVTFKARRPWISTTTLALIERRHNTRVEGDVELEHDVKMMIKKFVKKDRDAYLKSLACSGDWSKLRELRK